MSELFNASALTNLFSGLQQQIRHQQHRIAQLEALQLEHAAEKEVFEVQQAEFRAEMARKSEAFDKKVKEAMRNAGGDVAILRREFNREKGFRRLCSYVQGREGRLVKSCVEKWRSNASTMTLWAKKRRFLNRLGELGENKGKIACWNAWYRPRRPETRRGSRRP